MDPAALSPRLQSLKARTTGTAPSPALTPKKMDEKAV